MNAVSVSKLLTFIFDRTLNWLRDSVFLVLKANFSTKQHFAAEVRLQVYETSKMADNYARISLQISACEIAENASKNELELFC